MNKELFARLGNPHAGQNFIHVAGTNGKGSTCAMLAKVLECAGYRVGLFTSPHLDHYEERIKVNGIEINKTDWIRLEKIVDEASIGLDTVEFDRITAMGFLYFKEQKCDLTVLEVGLGGRLDATNVIDKSLVSAIASIGLEHTELLGNTISEIAFEKAGIIKAGVPVVAEYQGKEALDVFIKRAKELNAPLTITRPGEEILHSLSLDGQVISYKNHKGIKLNLLGSYQYKNVALVLDVLDVLNDRFPVTEDAIKKGLASVVWPGRFEVLRKSPLVILDGAHNPNGVEELRECLKAYLPKKKIHFVMGVMADKNYEAMLDLIAPFAKRFTVVSPDNERALDENKLQSLITNHYNIPAKAAKTVAEGIKLATENQDFREPVVIFGSLYQVAEIRKFFDLQESN